jgi:signal transduction histidine kinase
MMYELDRRQRLLVESHKLRAIGDLTAGVAHELNNPLNNIILTSEVLKDNYRELSADELADIAHDLVTQGERAQKVVKNLLDFARESETQTEYFRIAQLIDDTLELAKNQIKLSGITLEVQVPDNLPPIYGDRDLLKQVLLNLVLNAIDAMRGGGKLSIKVGEEKDTGFMKVEVTDTGEGIPSHLLQSIFNPFFTTKPTGQGTGLGLAVSRGIIENHGGDIEVSSTPGDGATFTVHLPIVPIPAGMKDRTRQE